MSTDIIHLTKYNELRSQEEDLIYLVDNPAPKKLERVTTNIHHYTVQTRSVTSTLDKSAVDKPASFRGVHSKQISTFTLGVIHVSNQNWKLSYMKYLFEDYRYLFSLKKTKLSPI